MPPRKSITRDFVFSEDFERYVTAMAKQEGIPINGEPQVGISIKARRIASGDQTPGIMPRLIKAMALYTEIVSIMSRPICDSAPMLFDRFMQQPIEEYITKGSHLVRTDGPQLTILYAANSDHCEGDIDDTVAKIVLSFAILLNSSIYTFDINFNHIITISIEYIYGVYEMRSETIKGNLDDDSMLVREPLDTHKVDALIATYNSNYVKHYQTISSQLDVVHCFIRDPLNRIQEAPVKCYANYYSAELYVMKITFGIFKLVKNGVFKMRDVNFLKEIISRESTIV